MAKNKPVPLDADESWHRTFGREATVRCAWCGMVPMAEDLSIIRATQLCAACSKILRHVDWRRLVHSQED